MGNVRVIEFSLEELFGTAEVIVDAINIREKTKATSSGAKRRRLAMLQDGLLETPRQSTR